MHRPPRAFGVRLAGIAAVGVGVRLVYLLTIGRHVTGIGDWHFYHWQANDLAAGRFFVEPFRLRLDGVSLPSAGHPPLYPAVLSIMSVLGGTSELAHRAVGLPLGAATIVLVGLLGRRVGGERLGLVAAVLCAAYPLMIAVDGALMSETLYGPLITVVMLAAYRLHDRPGRGIALGLGAIIGLAALTRSEALLLVPVLAWPVALRGGRGGAARAGLAALGCVLVLSPWTIRNAVEFGRFVPVSNNDSTVIAGANCPLTYHGVDLGGWNIRCISRRSEDNEAAQAATWRREGLDYARDHAGRLPVVAAIRLLRVWDLWQPRRQVIFAEGRQTRVEQAGVAMYFVLAVLGVAGALALRRRRELLLILLAPALAVSVSSVVGYGIPRLRHTFEPALLVLAAAGLVWLWDTRPWALAGERLRRHRATEASTA
jgi:4-amino-4-deoxy-L-arabinose transferase-like glycosyltransferase